MKGILGRKAGMTSVFSEHGRNIPVTIIEVQPNIVTNVLTKEKHGYQALQLSAFDRRDKTVSKPVLAHLKKAKTGAKYFTKEVRGMEGFALGDKVDGSIFTAGEYVDVTGISKGKGFAGTIKRHNQKIGPKSHGGGGGSKPVRLTGGLGDVASNRVFKGQTMPGHMGHVQRTMQNLEVISIDLANNIILIKGSIPGPNKGFVIVRQAAKGIASKDGVILVDVNEAKIKNELLETAKKAGADVNTDMSVEEMKAAIAAAKEAKEATKAAKEAEEKTKDAEENAAKVTEAATKAHDEAEKAAASGDEEKAKELEAKAEALDKQKEAEEAKAVEAKEEAKEAEAEAATKEAEAESLQVETEEEPAEEAKEAKAEEPSKEEEKKGDE